MFRRAAVPVLLLLSILRLPAAAPAGAEALLVVAGDLHSAYERTAQFVALVDRLKQENPALPVVVILNGDTQEYGNALARRSAGEIDFALYAALAKRAPTILNLGNHEPEFHAMAEVVRRAEAAGLRVVSNAVNRGTGAPFAPASLPLELGSRHAVVVGLTTDALSTYRAAVRPELDLADPVVWAGQNFPKLLSAAPTGAADAPLPIVLSHCGLGRDRKILPLVPDGTLYSGAHSHLRFVEPMGRTVYFHSGSWTEAASLAWLTHDEAGAARWVVESVPVPAGEPADPELAARIADVKKQFLQPEDTAVIGQTRRAYEPAEAARFVASIVRDGAGVDAAFLGNTTFGAGLPAGDVTQLAFDACVRFDGTIYTAEVDGARLLALLAAANQGPDTPFALRGDEFNHAAGPAPVDTTKRYRIATNDWGAKNTARYFGEPAIAWTERPDLKLKALVRARLVRDRIVAFPEAAPAASRVEPAAAPAEEDPLYALGKQLFEEYAPDEIKAEYEFPSKSEWDEFARRLQEALASNDLRRLAAYEPEARAALLALRALPEYHDYAEWLAERLDYIEVAKKAVAAAPARPRPAKPVTPPASPATPASPAGPAPGPGPAPDAAPTPPAAAPIPNYALWRERLLARPVPGRAASLLPRVQRVFVEEGVPAELAWLAETESTFNPGARSPVGAKGLFQLMPETAKSLGLQTFLPDERTDPEKSARAAAQYLRYLYGRFRDWPLVLAAYNAGEGRVGRTLQAEKAASFAEIAENLPAETRMYVPKVLATIEVRAGVQPEQLAAPRA